MNMLELSFPALRDALARSMNLDSEDGQVTPQVARQIARALNAAVQYCWRVYEWEEVTVVLKALTDEDCTLRGGSLLAPGYDVLGVFEEDPETAFEAGELPKKQAWRMARDGRIVVQGTVSPLYYQVRLAPPVFHAETWADTTVYAPGDGCFTAPAGVTTPGDSWRALQGNNDVTPVGFNDWLESGSLVNNSYYRVNGVLWRCIQNGTASDSVEPGYGADWRTHFAPTPHAWAPQRLPEVMREAVLAGASAWLERHAEGQQTSPRALERIMDEYLQDEVIRRARLRRGPLPQ